MPAAVNHDVFVQSHLTSFVSSVPSSHRRTRMMEMRSQCLLIVTGDRYVVVDCGGGTVDLTVHQIRLPEGHLKELYKASG